MTGSHTSSKQYRADIDGLRAIAVSSVVLFHAIPAALPGGFLGVDIFFVISGYLIGGIILRELVDLKTPFFGFIANFYARRARRILPALLVVLAVCLGLGWFILTQEEFGFLANTAAKSIIGLSNVTFWQYTNYFGPGSDEYPLLMTWSLGVEEQFYFIVPILLFGLVKMGQKAIWSGIALIILASFAASVWLSERQPDFAFYMLPTRAWELAAGVALAQWHRMPGGTDTGARFANLGAILGLALIVPGFFLITEDMPVPGFVTLFPVVGVMLLIHFRQSWLNRKALSCAPVVGIGLISYSWYLWHWPLMAFVRVSVPTDPAPALMLLVALLSGGLGYLSWRFVEQPFRHSGAKPLVTVGRYGVVAGGVMVAAIGLGKVDNVFDRLPDHARNIEQLVQAGRGACLVDPGDMALQIDDMCYPQGDGVGVALIGDSHAAALGPGLTEAAQANGVRLVQMSKSSCPPLLEFGSTQPSMTSHSECAVFMDAAIKRAIEDEAIETVVLSGFWPPQAEDVAPVFRERLQETTKVLGAAGKSVVLVEDVPLFVGHGPKMELASVMSLRAFIAGANELFSGERGRVAASPSILEEVLREEARTNPNVEYKRLRDIFCRDGSQCQFADERGLHYIDKHHLSIVGSRMIDWSDVMGQNLGS